MTKQGTQANNSRLVSIQDLDELLAQHALVPAVVKLGGAQYTIRTDLTAAETQRFLDLMGNGHSGQALTILVGTKAERDALAKAVAAAQRGAEIALPVGRQAAKLEAYLDSLPRMHTALASGRIMRASKVLAQHAKSEEEILVEYGYVAEEPVEPGESSAS
jgi:hypothetical protein